MIATQISLFFLALFPLNFSAINNVLPFFVPATHNAFQRPLMNFNLLPKTLIHQFLTFLHYLKDLGSKLVIKLTQANDNQAESEFQRKTNGPNTRGHYLREHALAPRVMKCQLLFISTIKIKKTIIVMVHLVDQRTEGKAWQRTLCKVSIFTTTPAWSQRITPSKKVSLFNIENDVLKFDTIHMHGQ